MFQQSPILLLQWGSSYVEYIIQTGQEVHLQPGTTARWTTPTTVTFHKTVYGSVLQPEIPDQFVL